MGKPNWFITINASDRAGGTNNAGWNVRLFRHLLGLPWPICSSWSWLALACHSLMRIQKNIFKVEYTRTNHLSLFGYCGKEDGGGKKFFYKKIVFMKKIIFFEIYIQYWNCYIFWKWKVSWTWLWPISCPMTKLCFTKLCLCQNSKPTT